MNGAIEAINEMQNDAYMREVARMRRKALNDEINSMSIARKEGRAEEKQKISLLTQILQKNNRLGELIPALQDEEKINALYKEFNIK